MNNNETNIISNDRRKEVVGGHDLPRLKKTRPLKGECICYAKEYNDKTSQQTSKSLKVYSHQEL